MFKKPISKSKPADTRLQKANVKRMRLAKAQRAAFLAQLEVTVPTAAKLQQAERLIKRVRAAKSAPFLSQYRIVD